MKRGENLPDSWYQQKYSIPDTIYYDLHNMSTGEVLAAFQYSIGNICREEAKYLPAVTQYQSALKLKPGYAEAQGNMAIALDASGDSQGALEILIRTKEAFPWLKNIEKNTGAVMIRCGLYSSAFSEYQKALKRDHEDSEAFYGLALACYYQKDFGRALHALQSAIFLQPDYREAWELKGRINMVKESTPSLNESKTR